MPALTAYAQFSLNRRSQYWYQSADGVWHTPDAEGGVDKEPP